MAKILEWNKTPKMRKMIGYELCTYEMIQFLNDTYDNQGIVANNCTGMYDFSFYPERLTFRATQDRVTPWENT